MVQKLNEAGIDITSDYEYVLDRETCKNVFEQQIVLWPKQVDVSRKQTTPQGKRYSPIVGEIYFRLEDEFENLLRNQDKCGTLDDWCVVGWAVNKCLYQRALAQDVIYPQELKFSEVEQSILVDHLGWKGQEPEGVTANSIITVDHRTGRILSIQNVD